MSDKKEMDNKKKEKRTLYLAGICFVAALAFAIIFCVHIFKKEENQETFEYNEAIEETEFSYSEFLGIASNKPEQINEDTESWDGYIVDDEPIIKEDFEIIGLTDEQIAKIDNDISGLRAAIQENLYFYGYYDYTEAVSTGAMETDDSGRVIILNFDITANEKINIDAIYHKGEQSWQIRVW